MSGGTGWPSLAAPCDGFHGEWRNLSFQVASPLARQAAEVPTPTGGEPESGETCAHLIKC